MKALCWHGKHDIRCDTVPDPTIQHPRDAIIKVTSCAICGSDLHIYDGVIPGMERGDVLGHETMGEVVEVGAEVTNLKPGDRVVVPFTISCGECFFCTRGWFSGCERSNPNHETAEKLWGHSPAGLFGYSHILGGYAGGQAEFLRVPYADVGPIKGNYSPPDFAFRQFYPIIRRLSFSEPSCQQCIGVFEIELVRVVVFTDQVNLICAFGVVRIA